MFTMNYVTRYHEPEEHKRRDPRDAMLHNLYDILEASDTEAGCLWEKEKKKKKKKKLVILRSSGHDKKHRKALCPVFMKRIWLLVKFYDAVYTVFEK